MLNGVRRLSGKGCLPGFGHQMGLIGLQRHFGGLKMTRPWISACFFLPLFCGCATETTDAPLTASDPVSGSDEPALTDVELTQAVRDACPRLDESKIIERINRVIERKDAGSTLEEQQVFWITPPLQCDTDELCPGFLTELCPPCERCWQAAVLFVYDSE
jgi:hypothetical protein